MPECRTFPTEVLFLGVPSNAEQPARTVRMKSAGSILDETARRMAKAISTKLGVERGQRQTPEIRCFYSSRARKDDRAS